MRNRRKIGASLVWGLVFFHAVAFLRAGDGSLRAKLVQLATRAEEKGDLTPLRRFASSVVDPELRGQAYLALGYREYSKRDFPAAAADLRQSAQAAFSLADVAAYYWAVSARAASQPEQVIKALDGFSSRYLTSPWRFKALVLLGEVLLEAGRAEQAIQTLATEPRDRQKPELTLLLGQAYRDAGKSTEAARTFQEIYYAFPATPESRAAAEALERLRPELGENSPQASEEIKSARAEILFKKSLLPEALADYEKLLAEHATSPLAPRWKLGRARCLIRLKKGNEAIESLGPGFAAGPELDARRLETLVEAYFRESNDAAALQTLDQLRVLYPESNSYASALSAAGNHFIRKGDWKTAVDYYRPLSETFPTSDLGREASWRMAWNYYLQGDLGAAARALADHLTRHPDSPHVPAALFWLGRIAEEYGATPEARQLYRSVQQRFVHSYFALQAGQRLTGLGSNPEPASQRGAFLVPVLASTLSQTIPPGDPLPVQPCTFPPPSETLRPYLALKDLGLTEIGEEYVVASLSDQPDSPDLLLALSLLRAGQGKSSAALLNSRQVVPKYANYEFSALPEGLWNLLFPRDYWKLVQRHARANALDPNLVMGLIRQESAFNPRATSVANARGLMQILPSTASPTRRGRIRAAQRLFDPAYNVQFGCRHLRGVLRQFSGDLERALAAYNAGDVRVKNWLAGHTFQDPVEFLETIPIPATRAYVEAVLRDAAIYRQLLGGTAKFAKCR